MEVIQVLGLVILVISSIAVLAVIEKKYDLNLGISSYNYDDMDCWGFGHQSTRKQLAEKDKTIAQLIERVEVLEKIVTDPAEQLKREINQL
ncbi:hypothetical protein [Thalassotalea atypica]|uniref:hypothetical protein n=1 Tax=Thalassotalea atypica TaxID=2054316 RepID=UPI0025740ABB|nr:hypothetical protein [Thalassotalea atypica]